MKPFLSCAMLLLASLGSSSLYGQGPPLGKEETSRNKIKEVRKYSNSICDPNAKNSDPSSNPRTWSSEVFRYDARGNLTHWSKASTWTQIQGYFAEYKYDDRDNVVEKTEDYVKTRYEHNYTLNDKGKIVEDNYPGGKHTIKYDATGSVLESSYLYEGRVTEKTTVAYDEKGYVEETLAYDSGGHISSRTVNVFDKAGHDIKREKYDSKGALSSRIIFPYDAAGHETAEEKYGADGHLSLKTVYSYDPAGHRIKEEHYDPNGKSLADWRTFKFDANGLVIETDDFNSKGECNWLTKITYEFYP